MRTFIEVLTEETGKKAVFGFVRMNPPSVGHEKLIKKAESVAKRSGAQTHIVLSRSEGTGKDPLPAAKKAEYVKKIAAPSTNVSVATKEHPTLLHHLSKLHASGVEHVTIVGGSDRVKEYHDLAHKYNGQTGKHGHFNFKSIKVVSAGKRDPDAEGTTGISGTKMRAYARSGNMEGFKSGLPKALHPHAEEIAGHIRAVKESVIEDDE